MATKLHLLRQLIAEIRSAVPSGHLRDSLAIRYIFGQFKKYKTTDLQLCKAQEEIKFTGETFLCYLRSIRKYHEINKAFQGKGERSIQETANMVGFKLPHDPK